MNAAFAVALQKVSRVDLSLLPARSKLPTMLLCALHLPGHSGGCPQKQL